MLFYDWAGNKTKAKNETKVIENKTHSNVTENYETKNSIKYLSNQTLLGKYSYFKDNGIINKIFIRFHSGLPFVTNLVKSL